jgi:hypothetical protein
MLYAPAGQRGLLMRPQIIELALVPGLYRQARAALACYQVDAGLPMTGHVPTSVEDDR